jgi:hypothetical protein
MRLPLTGDERRIPAGWPVWFLTRKNTTAAPQSRPSLLEVRAQLHRLLQRRGSLLLMWLLIAVTLASPIADDYPHAGAGLALTVLFGVLVGTRISANRTIMIRVVLPLSGLWIGTRLLEGFGYRPIVCNFAGHVIGLLLSCTILWAIFGRLRTCEVTSGVLAEAFISYLTIAIAFSQLFWLLNQAVTDAFRPSLLPAHGTDFLYFSMVTLTGVGYGGIVPLNSFVRLVAALETMAGIFYVAVVVARLAGIFHRTKGALQD